MSVSPGMAGMAPVWKPPGIVPVHENGLASSVSPAGTRFRVTGSGPVVVLIHGVGLDLTMWDGISQRLASEYTVVRYDMLGHGGTAPVDGPASLDTFVRQLETLAAELELECFALVGFSMGAMVAQGYALAHPDRLAALVLLNSVHDRSSDERKAVRARLNAAKQDGPSTIVEAAIERWFTPDFRGKNPAMLDAVRQRLHGNDREGFLAAYRVFAEGDADLTVRIHAIRCATLAATGGLDSGSTPAMTRRLAAAIPGARAAILPGLAHMAPVEGAAAVADLLLDFFAEVRAG